MNTDTHIEALAITDEIARWVRCESPSHSRPHLAQMAGLIEAKAISAGLATRRIALDAATGPALCISNRPAGDKRRGILILGHYDTVHPVGTLALNPCRIEAGLLYGPGSYDMKAGAYLALAALVQVRDRTALPVDYLLVPDEEIGSRYSRAVTEQYGSRARYALVAEPARADGGRCVTARKGTGLITVKACGCPAHAGVAHHKGRSAIRELAHQVLALEALTDYAKGITVSVGTIEGGTTTNVIPAHAKAVADVRIPDAQAGQYLRDRLRGFASVDPDVSVEIDLRLNRPPMPRTHGQGEIFEQARRLAANIGFTLEDAPPTGGGSDANFTAAMGVPSLDGLGADGDGAHTLNEYVRIDTLPIRLQLWKEMLQSLA